MQIPWYASAIGAAVIWGVHYPLIDFALRRVSLVTVLLLTALPIVLLAPFFHRALLADVAALQRMGTGDRATVLSLALTSLLGSVLLFVSIVGKNATLASVIEISYPVFVALFAFLLFRQVHVNASVLAGAALVFAGVMIIVWNNP